MQTYDELLGRKTSLEFEINTYRRLLECEETRLSTRHSAEINSSQSQSQSSYQYQSRSSNATSSGAALATSSNLSSTSASNASNAAAAANVIINPMGQRSATTQRGSSVEQTTETVMKRMQVQRTSKGIYQQFDYDY
jgi:hypothetical protein